MASLIFAQAKSIRKNALKDRDERAQAAVNLAMLEGKPSLDDLQKIEREAKQEAYDMAVQHARHEFREIIKIAKMLNEDYQEITGLVTKQQYFITIRPDHTKVDFDSFYDIIYKLVNRSCFTKYRLSFEQKGKRLAELGDGFHCHIVAETTHRSKGECIRAICSTFNKWINLEWITDNNIDVKPCKNPDEIVNKYLIEYESNDEHKVLTMDADKVWRQRMNLNSLYENNMPKRRQACMITEV